jgi:sodium/hydrogen antiporter
MTALLAFAVILLVAVLISDLAHRSVLSTAVLFLAAGFLLGPGVADVVKVDAREPVVRTFAELALFSVLFTDGMRAGLGDLVSAWRLPGRALLLGMPLTAGLTAVAARYVAGLPWLDALLIGAALAPTDPVFAAAIVGREGVPYRLRHLLNVESGLNDGLALPAVVLLIAAVSSRPAEPGRQAVELAVGVAIGVAFPWAAIRLERLPGLSATAGYQPLYAVAIGLGVLGLARLADGNLFLAAFAAGITVATVGPEVREAFHRFGDLVAELLKLAAVMLFGALVSPRLLAEIPPAGYLFALIAVFVVRTVALGLSLAGSELSRREYAAAVWFGPKGFASVVYGLLILQSGIPQGVELFHLVAIVIVISIVAHSSTDVLVARAFERETPAPP